MQRVFVTFMRKTTIYNFVLVEIISLLLAKQFKNADFV